MFSEKKEKRCPQPPTTVNFQFFYFYDLEINSRAPKSYRFFVMLQLYIHENLIRIQPLVHKVSYRHESVTPTPMPTPTDPHQTQYVRLPVGGVHNCNRNLGFTDSLHIQFEGLGCMRLPHLVVYTTNLILEIVTRIILVLFGMIHKKIHPHRRSMVVLDTYKWHAELPWR